MIQFNKTIFQFTKRLALVVLLIGVSSAMYGGGHTNHYTQVRVSAYVDNQEWTGNNLVYVSDGEESDDATIPNYNQGPSKVDTGWDNQTGSLRPQSAQVEESALVKFQECGGDENNDKHSYTLYANTEDSNVKEKYRFAGWFDNIGKSVSTNTSGTMPNIYEFTINQGTTPVFFTDDSWDFSLPIIGNISIPTKWHYEFNNYTDYIAKWVVPRVEKVNDDYGTNNIIYIPKLIEEPQYGNTYIVDVVFLLTDEVDINDYVLTVKKNNGTETEQGLETSNYDKSNHTYKYKVSYTLKNTNHTHDTYEITLRSKYQGNDSNKSFKTAIVSLEEDYTPRFEAIEEEFKFIVELDENNNLKKPLFSNEQGVEDNSLNYPFKPVCMNTMANIANDWQCIIEDDVNLPEGAVFEIIGYEKDENNNDILYSPIVKFSLEDGYSFDVEATYSATLYLTPNIKGTSVTIDGKTSNTISTFITPEGWNANKTKLAENETVRKQWAEYENNANVVVKKINLVASSEPTILIDNKTSSTVEFDIISSENKSTTQTYLYTANIAADKYEISPLNENHIISFNSMEDIIQNNVIVTISHDAIPTLSTTPYERTLSLGNVEKDKHASLTVKVNVELATPTNLTATPTNGTITLDWSNVYNANHYIISKAAIADGMYDGEKWNEVSIGGDYIAKLDATLSFSHTGLENNKPYDYYVTAVYVNEAGVIIDHKCSEKITAVPANYPKTITFETADLTGLETGTETGVTEEGFPYMTRRNINVKAAFKGDETVLVDLLYIFGLTIPNGNKEIEEDAITPCYVYRSNLTNDENSKQYEFVKVVQNVNVDQLDAAFLLSESDDVKSIYITGYAPFATAGVNENAVFDITKVGDFNVYLDNAQIYTRSKSDKSIDLKNNNILEDEKYLYSFGSAAVFNFASSSNIKPFIHVNDNNILDAAIGMTLMKSKTAGVEFAFVKHSSPIQLTPKYNQTFTLTINDVWNGVNTSGKLSLQEENGGSLANNYKEQNSAPSIDLGNEKTTVYINGGQIFMHNATDQQTTPISRAISWRKKVQTISGTAVTAYGFEAHQEGGTVCFKDGTVNNVAGNTNALVCPANTTIDGGSFNCNITRGNDDNGDPLPIYNSFDNTKALKLLDIDVTDYIQEGKVVITDHDAFMDDIFPLANYLNANTSKYESLSGYYQEKGKGYGLTSLTPEGNVVHLMLHQKGTPTINEWAIAGRNVNILKNTENVMTLEGQVRCVDQVEGDEGLFGQTYKMLYMEKDAFGYLDNNGAEYDIDKEYSVAYGEEKYTIQPINAQTTITNTKQYTIKEKVYMLKPIVAAKWMLFTPPFDVANVYIIESYPEEQLVKDYSEGNPNKIITGQYIQEARQAQAQRTMDLYMAWYGGRESSKDFFESDFLTSWKLYESIRDKDGATPAEGSNYMPIIGKLCNFVGKDNSLYPDGMKWWNANYYIYKSTDDWTFDQTAANFGTKWELVETLPDQTDTDGKQLPIMEAGETYAIEFPYNVGGHDPNAMWDYWTGKYILIESTEGPHTILGSDFAMVNGATASDGSAFLWGNSTFASCTIPTDYQANAWVMEKRPISSKDIDLGDGQIATITKYESKFVSAKEQEQLELLPTENFLLANFQAPAKTRARSINYKTGEVTYEKIDDNNPGLGSGIPTIMGDLSLMVVPTAEGLTITPLKEQHVMLFDAEGKMIFSKYMSEEENVSLPTGVYVVRGEYEQVKAIKK